MKSLNLGLKTSCFSCIQIARPLHTIWIALLSVIGTSFASAASIVLFLSPRFSLRMTMTA